MRRTDSCHLRQTRFGSRVSGGTTASAVSALIVVPGAAPGYVVIGLDTEKLTPDCPNRGIIVPHCEGRRVAVARATAGDSCDSAQTVSSLDILEMCHGHFMPASCGRRRAIIHFNMGGLL